VRPLLVPARRLVEATVDQVVATGSSLGAYGVDPIDGDTGFRLAGSKGRREVPEWTREKARTYSVTAYRSNPMATSVIDTYVSFCVGDSGVTWQATNPQVADVVREFWDDPANRLGHIQELFLRSQLLMGEKLLELMTAPLSGVVRFAPHDPATISDITVRAGNPLWPAQAVLGDGDDARRFDLAQVDDATGLRAGDAMFWAPWRTLDTDTRGMPFLTPILDWLDSYDTVLSNLIDRTALARYMVWDVSVQGGQDKVDEFVKARGGLHVPPSGSVEVHNDAITWKPQTVSTGAFEDTAANSSVLTNIASGAGLAKTWLAEPDGANRATSQSMAEPVRRRVGSVQKVWLGQIQELLRYVVDQAVASKRLQPMVDATDPRTGAITQVPASQTVTVTGPEIAAADSQLTAQVLLNLSTGLENLVNAGVLTKGAAATAARKAWEDYVGVPYVHELDSPTANPDDVATQVEEAARARTRERHRDPRDYVRDGDGRFADVPGLGHLAHLGGPGAAPSRPADDPLKLAGRIDLAPGERFGGSAVVVDNRYDFATVMARVDGPGGPTIRFGVVSSGDEKLWRAADKGRTAELSGPQAAELRQVLDNAPAKGKQSIADYRAQVRSASKAGRLEEDAPDVEAPIDQGIIRAGWGGVRWSLTREEGGSLSLAGGGDWTDASWLLELDPGSLGAAEAGGEVGRIDSAASAGKISKAIGRLLDAPAGTTEAAGGNSNQLKHYWTEDPEGLAKWATSPHPWTALRDHLVKYMSPERANQTASQWFHSVFHMWPGERKGSNPVGPG
jgi:hypothetical protein